MLVTGLLTNRQRAILVEIVLTNSLGPAYLGSGGSSLSTALCSPMGLAEDSRGRLYVSDRGDGLGRVVWRIEEDGTARVIAGSGRAGNPPPGPADIVSLHRPDAIEIGPSGGLYVVDGYQHSVYFVDDEGQMSVVAGTGEAGYSGDGGPATRAQLSRPGDIRTDRFGGVYISDVRNHSVRYVDAEGIISTVVGTGVAGLSSDGINAHEASLNSPWGIALDRAGRLVISDSENNRVRRVRADGSLETLAGNGVRGYSGDGGPARRASLDSPQALFVDDRNRVFIVDEHNHAVRMVDENGIISTVIGNGAPGRARPGTLASDAALNDPESILINSEGELIIADGNNFRVLKVEGSGVVSPVLGDGDPLRCRTLRSRIRSLLAGDSTEDYIRSES